MAGRNLTMEDLAAYLAALPAYFAHPLVDQIGLVSRFDFTLQWTWQTNNPVTPDPGTTMQEALEALVQWAYRPPTGRLPYRESQIIGAPAWMGMDVCDVE